MTNQEWPGPIQIVDVQAVVGRRQEEASRCGIHSRAGSRKVRHGLLKWDLRRRDVETVRSLKGPGPEAFERKNSLLTQVSVWLTLQKMQHVLEVH